MAYRISFKKSVAKDLKKIDKKSVQIILEKIENELGEKTEKLPELKGQFTDLRKYRIGNYRVIFTILHEEIIILRVVHRKDVYRK